MLTALRALWLREITKFLRDRSRLVGALIQPLGFWVLLGLGFYGTFQMPGADDVGYLEYLYPGIIALILLFTAIFSTISVVQERQEGFLQATLVAPVPRLTIVLGLVSGGTTLAVAEAVLFLLLAGSFELTRAVNSARRITTVASSIATMIASDAKGSISSTDLHYAFDSAMMRVPAGSSSTFAAIAASVAPELMPTSRPSSRAQRRAISLAASASTGIAPSIAWVCRLAGMNPAPMPWIG